MENFSPELIKAQTEALEIREKAIKIKEGRNEQSEPNRKDYETASNEITNSKKAKLEERSTDEKSLESEISPEAIESREIASEKLKKIMGDNFKDYAVRFVNIKEYESILNNRKFEPGETFVPKLSKWRGFNSSLHGDYEFKYPYALNFKEYLAKKGNGGSWHETAVAQTYDADASASLNAQWNLLRNFLRRSRRDVKKEGKAQDAKQETESDRIKTLRHLREEIIRHLEFPDTATNSWKNTLRKLIDLEKLRQEFGAHQITDEQRKKFDETIVGIRNAISEKDLVSNISQANIVIKEIPNITQKQEKDWLRTLNSFIPDEHFSRFGVDTSIISLDKEYKTVLHEFIANPDYILQQGNLRKVITALSMSLRNQAKMYHVALIFDSSAVSEKQSWGGSPFAESEKDEWRILKKIEDDPNQAAELLGAIVVMPNRDIVEKVVTLSAQAQEFSHPVFDSQEIVRWPK